MIKKAAFLSLFLWSMLPLMAQDGGLSTGEVDVVKNFDARLISTDKKDVTPVIPPLDTVSRKQYYNLLTKPIQVQYLPPKIRPLSHKRDKIQDNYNGLLKLGAGFPNAFYGEGFYRVSSFDKKKKGSKSKAKSQYLADINLTHNSANNTKRTENQRFAHTNGEVNGTFYSDQGFAVNGQLGYDYNKVHFYGYNDINKAADSTLFSFEPEQVEQAFKTFYGKASIYNAEPLKLGFDYFAGVDFYILDDLYASSEKGLDLDLGIVKWINDSDPLSITLNTSFVNFKNGEKKSLQNFSLNPSYTYHGSGFKVKVGVNIASANDNFFFFPDAEISANIIDGVVNAFVGATGNIYENSFKNLTDYNPFLESKITIRNSKNSNYYGGVKGKFQGVKYHAQAGYKQIENLALFQLSDLSDSIPRFDVVYDTANIVYIKATLETSIFTGLDVYGVFNQNIYSLQNQDKAWHLPSLTVNAGAKYTHELEKDKKVAVKAELYVQNGVPVQDQDGNTEHLNPLFDINVGAEYYFTKNIGAFVQLNNLANNRYQRWQRYPMLGLNGYFGISARF